jgi:DNA-binding NarL/FixJ family response regulator
VGAVAERIANVPLNRTARFAVLVVVGPLGPRESVSRMVRGLGAREVVPVGSVEEARRRARLLGPHALCITDATLPDGSGVSLLRELRRAGWRRGVVLSTAHDVYAVRGALAAGVRCFLVSGRPCGVAAVAVGGLSDQLSEREVEVLQQVANGRSNKEIGALLGLSALTVKSHLARIARKVGTGDRAEIVMLSLRAGIIH